MQHLITKLAIVAMVLGFAKYGRAIEPPTPKNIDSMSVAQLEAAGDEARGQKDYEQAIRYFQAALRKDRKNAVLYNKLGLTNLKKDDLAQASFAFLKATKLNPKFADALNNLGAVDYMQRNFNAAIKQFKKAVALDEGRATFHVNLGAAWFGQKKIERAVAEYARALELDPEILNRTARTGVVAQITNTEERAKFSYMMAKIYARRGETEQCFRCLRTAKESGYRGLAGVYKDEEFADLRADSRLADIVPPPEK